MKPSSSKLRLALAACAAACFALPALGADSFGIQKPITIVDANGKSMGRLGNGFLQIDVNSKRYSIVLNTAVQPNGIPSPVYSDYSSLTFFFYESNDCTGPAYSQSSTGIPPLAVTTVNTSTGKVLLYPTSDVVENITFNSAFYLPTSFCETGSATTPLVRVQQHPIDITDLYQRPFHLK